MGEDDDTIPGRRVTPTPGQWLRAIESHPDGYADLLAIHGDDLMRAAYTLARARILARGEPPAPPTAHELHGAASEIHARAHCTGLLPSRDTLVADALAAHLEVARRD